LNHEKHEKAPAFGRQEMNHGVHGCTRIAPALSVHSVNSVVESSWRCAPEEARALFVIFVFFLVQMGGAALIRLNLPHRRSADDLHGSRQDR
jgi:hypothetical protein